MRDQVQRADASFLVSPDVNFMVAQDRIVHRSISDRGRRNGLPLCSALTDLRGSDWSAVAYARRTGLRLVLEPDAIETIALHRKRAALGSGRSEAGVSPMRIKVGATLRGNKRSAVGAGTDPQPGQLGRAGPTRLPPAEPGAALGLLALCSGSGGVSPMRIKIRLLFAETSVLP